MASCGTPGCMNNSQDKVTRLVLQGLEEGTEGMLGLPPSSPTDEVCLQGAAGGVVLEEGALGRGRWGVMAEKGGEAGTLALRTCPLLGPCPPSWLLLLVPLDSSFPLLPLLPLSFLCQPLSPSPELPVHPPLSFFTQGDSRKAFKRGSINHTVLLQHLQVGKSKTPLCEPWRERGRWSCTRCRHKPSLQHEDTLAPGWRVSTSLGKMSSTLCGMCGQPIYSSTI